MSDYLYAVIPYSKGVTLYSPDELEEGRRYPVIPELKGVDSEYAEEDGLILFADFLMINTCGRQSWFANIEDGYSQLRAEIYKIALALGAREVWYVAEMATDEMYDKDFSFEDWILSFKEGTRYASELTLDVLKDRFICTYYHDDFSDIILDRPEKYGQTGDSEEDEDDEGNKHITQVVSLLNDGKIQIELKNSHWEDILTIIAISLREANDKLKGMLAERHIDYPNHVHNTYEDKDGCIQRTLMLQYVKALDLASWKHHEQKDKAGKAYFGHIARVSNACKTPPAKVVALLHDVIEDTDVTPEQLEELDFSEFVIKAVLCLTRLDGETYEDFIKRAANNPIAREVKIADLEDNMDVRRLTEVKEEDIKRADKYMKAWKYLRNYENKQNDYGNRYMDTHRA